MMGGFSFEQVRAVAVDGEGNALVTRTFDGDVLMSAGGYDIWVAKLAQ